MMMCPLPLSLVDLTHWEDNDGASPHPSIHVSATAITITYCLIPTQQGRRCTLILTLIGLTHHLPSQTGRTTPPPHHILPYVTTTTSSVPHPLLLPTLSYAPPGPAPHPHIPLVLLLTHLAVAPHHSADPHPPLLCAASPPLSYTPPGLASHPHIPLTLSLTHLTVVLPRPPWHARRLADPCPHLPFVLPRHPDIPARCS
jgi:hypothetical protein